MRFALKMIVATAALAATTVGALAQQKITIGGTPNTGPATAMVADIEGILKARLTRLTLITINLFNSAAPVSGSLHRIPTPTTFCRRSTVASIWW
jgi:ABC-type nitrate/sulfonate/bicarbonate transport system substrate-binding protein